MRLNFILWSGILGLLFTLSSCREPQAPMAQRFRIKKVAIVYNNGSPIYYLYSYGVNNQLTARSCYHTYTKLPDFEFSKTILSYDVQGQLTKTETTFKYDSITMSSPNYPILTYQFTTSYEYDTDGNIVAMKKYNARNGNPGYKTLDEEYALVYDKAKLPKKVTTKINTGWQFDPTYYFSEEYTYLDTNVVEIKQTYLPTRLNQYTSSTYTKTLQYDNNLNPFYGLIDFGFDQSYALDIRSICKNNLIKNDEIYSYNSNGLLIRSVQTNGDREIKYEYESY